MNGYAEIKITFSDTKANKLAAVILLPICFFWIALVLLFWGHQATFDFIYNHIYSHTWHILGLMLIGVLFHELLHAAGWLPFCKSGIKSISFGFDKKGFSPYCHCSDILKINHFRIGVLLPALVLGLIIPIVGLALVNPAMILLGVYFIVTSSGDILTLWYTRKEKSNCLVGDSADFNGCLVYRPISE